MGGCDEGGGGDGGAGRTSVTHVVVVTPNRVKAHVSVKIVETVSESQKWSRKRRSEGVEKVGRRGRFLGVANTVLGVHQPVTDILILIVI